jgi:hypothetical protein
LGVSLKMQLTNYITTGSPASLAKALSALLTPFVYVAIRSENFREAAGGFVIEDACVVAGKGYGSTISSPRRRREAAA